MQDGVHTPRLPFDAVDQDVGGVACPAAANRVHQDPVLALHAIEDPGHAAEQRRHGQHPQHVTGRRSVDDEAVVFAGGAEIGELQQRGDLVDPREREAQESRHVVAIEPRAAERDLFEQLTAGGNPSLERGRRVDLDSLQIADALDAAGSSAERLAQGVAKRGRRISGNDQRAAPGARRADTQGSSARRLADAAFASDEPECGNR